MNYKEYYKILNKNIKKYHDLSLYRNENTKNSI